jgi:hypothetical protein
MFPLLMPARSCLLRRCWPWWQWWACRPSQSTWPSPTPSWGRPPSAAAAATPGGATEQLQRCPTSSYCPAAMSVICPLCSIMRRRPPSQRSDTCSNCAVDALPHCRSNTPCPHCPHCPPQAPGRGHQLLPCGRLLQRAVRRLLHPGQAAQQQRGAGGTLGRLAGQAGRRLLPSGGRAAGAQCRQLASYVHVPRYQSRLEQLAANSMSRWRSEG